MTKDIEKITEHGQIDNGKRTEKNSGLVDRNPCIPIIYRIIKLRKASVENP